MQQRKPLVRSFLDSSRVLKVLLCLQRIQPSAHL
nr:MAG TPA: hypothetical protein [Caudoviricetes sp.]